MPFETTATRLWKRLTPDERLQAAGHFWESPPEDQAREALGLIVKARRLRPQVARSLNLESRAHALASVLEPGEAVAASLLVALHLGERRSLLTTFLDAVGLPHENGLLKEESPSPPPLGEAAARAGVQALLSAFPRPQVATYLNTLWLQDPQRWDVLAKGPDRF